MSSATIVRLPSERQHPWPTTVSMNMVNEIVEQLLTKSVHRHCVASDSRYQRNQKVRTYMQMSHLATKLERRTTPKRRWGRSATHITLRYLQSEVPRSRSGT